MTEDMILKWSKYFEMVNIIAKYNTLKDLIIDHKDMIQPDLYDFLMIVIKEEVKKK